MNCKLHCKQSNFYGTYVNICNMLTVKIFPELTHIITLLTKHAQVYLTEYLKSKLQAVYAIRKLND